MRHQRLFIPQSVTFHIDILSFLFYYTSPSFKSYGIISDPTMFDKFQSEAGMALRPRIILVYFQFLAPSRQNRYVQSFSFWPQVKDYHW
jgi:hypothetical protein